MSRRGRPRHQKHREPNGRPQRKRTRTEELTQILETQEVVLKARKRWVFNETGRMISDKEAASPLLGDDPLGRLLWLDRITDDQHQGGNEFRRLYNRHRTAIGAPKPFAKCPDTPGMEPVLDADDKARRQRAWADMQREVESSSHLGYREALRVCVLWEWPMTCCTCAPR